MNHPLPIGERVSYSDLSPRENATVVLNDNTDPRFAAIVQAFNEKYGNPDLFAAAPVPVEHMDYVLLFDGELEVIPVQKDGIGEPLPPQEEL